MKKLKECYSIKQIYKFYMIQGQRKEGDSLVVFLLFFWISFFGFFFWDFDFFPNPQCFIEWTSQIFVLVDVSDTKNLVFMCQHGLKRSKFVGWFLVFSFPYFYRFISRSCNDGPRTSNANAPNPRGMGFFDYLLNFPSCVHLIHNYSFILGTTEKKVFISRKAKNWSLVMLECFYQAIVIGIFWANQLFEIPNFDSFIVRSTHKVFIIDIIYCTNDPWMNNPTWHANEILQIP